MDHKAQFHRRNDGGRGMTTSPNIQGPIIQGWCPGALRPMLSGDGLVVRIRPRAGRLTPDQARGIAELASQHGNGLIDLSNRANVQLRGVTEASHPALIEGLRALDLVDPDASAEGRRNIVVSPFWTESEPTQAFAHQLAVALGAPGAPQISNKFGFAVDTAATPCLRDTAADIWLETGPEGLLLASHSDLAKPVTETNAVSEALALAQWFVDNGGLTNGRGRMADLLKRTQLPAGFSAKRLPSATKASPGPTARGQLVAFEFGQMRAETLAALAGLGPLRITPWRMLLIEGLTEAPHIPGLITDANDPMLRVIACTGAPGCLQAHSSTRDIGRALAQQVTETLHVSGCAKGCAHPLAAPITLTATPAGFNLIRGGTASGPVIRAGLSASDLTETLLNECP